MRRKLIKKYNMYYAHWIDYSILISFISMIGLIVGLVEWEHNYPNRGDEGDILASNVFCEWLIMITSVLGVVGIVLKYRMEATWRNYKNPIKFYRKILRQQVDAGLLEETEMNKEQIKRENPFGWMIRLPIFWCEIMFMILTPLPMNDPNSFFGLKIIYLNCVNWADYGGDNYPTGAHVYSTPYLTNDIFLATMFLRFFFVMQALVYTSPPNNKLVGKRVCHELEIDPTFEF